LERNFARSMERDRALPMVTPRFVLGMACVAALSALAIGGALLPAGAQEDPPPLVHRAVMEYAATHRGNMTFSRHLAFAMHVGPIGKDVRNEVGILMRDGAYVRTKYYSGETNGHPDNDAALRRQEQSANDDLAAGRGFFKRPVDPRFVDDYRFEIAACPCERDTEKIQFTSVVRDAQHGDGTLVVDKATARVLSIEYEMNRPPDHASSGHVVETYGDAGPGVWTCVHTEETYKGKVGFVGGNATLTYTYDHFKRLSNADAAVAALENHTL
jgi:hypothetical protein